MDKLKNMKIWVCFRIRPDRNGRITKKPFSALGGATGSNDAYSRTWVSYAEAKSAAQRLCCNAVGFVLPKGYFFLDLDNRSVDDPFTQKFLKRFHTYAERSFSGKGIHLYGQCDSDELPCQIDSEGQKKLNSVYYTKHPRLHMELYIGGLDNRFAVYTGDTVQDAPLTDSTEAIRQTLEEDMRKKSKPSKPVSAHTTDTEFDEAELVDIIADLGKYKNGDKFRRLYYDGDISEYGSHSEADAALCAIIAFRVGPNPNAINTIFRESALFRPEKWEREDYRASTIECGIRACNGTFHHSVRSKPDFVIFNPATKRDEVSCPLLARYIRENLHYIFVRDDARSGVLRYVYEDGVYRLYSDDMLKGRIKDVIMSYDENLVRMGKVNEVFAMITTDNRFLPMDAINADEDLINFQNGLLRLSDMTLLPHTPDVYSTIRIPCNWTNDRQETPVFDHYLKTLTNHDSGNATLLLEFMGACLSNIKGWRMKKALFLYGDGDTGKSILKTLTERLLGKGNYTGIDLEDLEARFGTGNIYAKRLAGSSDMSFLTVEELKTFKKVTGGDSLFAEFKGQNGFEFVYDGLLWFCMNRLPKFGGDDGKWVYDRIMQIECRNVIPLERQDKRLIDRLYAEREGIIYQTVTALKRVISNGYRFSEPDSVRNNRKAYMEENNTVIRFFKECMVLRPGNRITDECTVGKTYAVYAAWCRDNNHGYAKTAKEFREEIARYLGEDPMDMTVRRKCGIQYRQYTLTNDTVENYRKAYGYDPYRNIQLAGA